MIAMTTSNSINVKPVRSERDFLCDPILIVLLKRMNSELRDIADSTIFGPVTSTGAVPTHWVRPSPSPSGPSCPRRDTSRRTGALLGRLFARQVGDVLEIDADLVFARGDLHTRTAGRQRKRTVRLDLAVGRERTVLETK